MCPINSFLPIPRSRKFEPLPDHWESDLSEVDQKYMAFGRAFEAKFVTQGMEDNRTVKESLDIAWDILSLLPKSELDRLSDEIIENFL